MFVRKILTMMQIQSCLSMLQQHFPCGQVVFLTSTTRRNLSQKLNSSRGHWSRVHKKELYFTRVGCFSSKWSSGHCHQRILFLYLELKGTKPEKNKVTANPPRFSDLLDKESLGSREGCIFWKIVLFTLSHWFYQ